MNVLLNLEDASWKNFVSRTLAVLRSPDNLLKRAFLIVWPKDAKDHFEQEMGWDGHWAPWKESTRRQRMAHELATATSAGIKRRQAAGVRAGGRLLQITGRLRTQTVQEPIFTQLPHGLKVESPTPYSGYLDEGTERMQARPFMWLGDDAQELMSKVFADALGEASGTD